MQTDFIKYGEQNKRDLFTSPDIFLSENTKRLPFGEPFLLHPYSSKTYILEESGSKSGRFGT